MKTEHRKTVKPHSQGGLQIKWKRIKKRKAKEVARDGKWYAKMRVPDEDTKRKALTQQRCSCRTFRS
jgi:hypothetical protein